jgi:hypothetical protein
LQKVAINMMDNALLLNLGVALGIGLLVSAAKARCRQGMGKQTTPWPASALLPLLLC